MKYQVIKHNKTGGRQIALVPSLAEAVAKCREVGARFDGFSYIGGFPRFKDIAKNKTYSIQGSVDMGVSSVVCSIPQKEIENFTF